MRVNAVNGPTAGIKAFPVLGNGSLQLRFQLGVWVQGVAVGAEEGFTQVFQIAGQVIKRAGVSRRGVHAQAQLWCET